MRLGLKKQIEKKRIASDFTNDIKRVDVHNNLSSFPHIFSMIYIVNSHLIKAHPNKNTCNQNQNPQTINRLGYYLDNF